MPQALQNTLNFSKAEEVYGVENDKKGSISGPISGPFWVPFRIHFGSHLGSISGPISDHFGLHSETHLGIPWMLEKCPRPYTIHYISQKPRRFTEWKMIKRGPFWVPFGIHFGPHLGSILGPILDHFGLHSEIHWGSPGSSKSAPGLTKQSPFLQSCGASRSGK